jgi:hypothetical protein
METGSSPRQQLGNTIKNTLNPFQKDLTGFDMMEGLTGNELYDNLAGFAVDMFAQPGNALTGAALGPGLGRVARTAKNWGKMRFSEPARAQGIKETLGGVGNVLRTDIPNVARGKAPQAVRGVPKSLMAESFGKPYQGMYKHGNAYMRKGTDPTTAVHESEHHVTREGLGRQDYRKFWDSMQRMYKRGALKKPVPGYEHHPPAIQLEELMARKIGDEGHRFFKNPLFQKVAHQAGMYGDEINAMPNAIPVPPLFLPAYRSSQEFDRRR